MEHKYFSSCCFCASGNVEVVDYLNYSGGSISRNAGYILPTALATMFSRASSGFARHYYPVKVNKRFFSRKAVYCKNCQTGYVSPQFSEQELDEYYRDFYWSNRGDMRLVKIRLDRCLLVQVLTYLERESTGLEVMAPNCHLQLTLAPATVPGLLCCVPTLE